MWQIYNENCHYSISLSYSTLIGPSLLQRSIYQRKITEKSLKTRQWIGSGNKILGFLITKALFLEVTLLFWRCMCITGIFLVLNWK